MKCTLALTHAAKSSALESSLRRVPFVASFISGTVLHTRKSAGSTTKMFGSRLIRIRLLRIFSLMKFACALKLLSQFSRLITKVLRVQTFNSSFFLLYLYILKGTLMSDKHMLTDDHVDQQLSNDAVLMPEHD